MYAIVRSGGRQHKVAVGDVLTVDKITNAEVGSTVNLTPLMLVDGDAKFGPFNAGGVVMFALYFFGAVSAMITAALVKKFTSRGGPLLPFYMEMPPYQIPRLKSVLLEVWTAASMFLRKVSTIILATSIVICSASGSASDPTSCTIS